MNLKRFSPQIISIGLGIIFLANSYTAFFSPSEFKELITNSFLVSLVPISAEMFVKFIGISDGLVGALLILGLFRKYVSLYAGLWVIGVIIVGGLGDIGGFLEHLGILAMPLYLYSSGNKENGEN